MLDTIMKEIDEPNYAMSKMVQSRLDNLTKPPGSLGRLEDLAKKVVEITQQENPTLSEKVIFTLAADHGVVEEGVSAFPKEVTPQMVINFIKGGAAINVLARHIGARVVVADIGVSVDLKQYPEIITKKVAYGTQNMTKGPAMTRAEAIKSIENGMEIFQEEYRRGIDILGTGDMGIGNTTPASAITASITGTSVEEVTGRGTGINHITLAHKINTIKKAIRLNMPDRKDPLDILAKLGGFEIGGIIGIILIAAQKRVPIVIDGFISGAAALIACQLEPKVKPYLLASHRSVEKGHSVILDFLKLSPILDLGLRLGEGTGAALAMGIIEAGVKILTEMATFQDAGVTDKK